MRSLIETTFAAGASSQASALLGGMLVNSIGAASIDAAEIYLSEQGYAVNPHWRLRMRALRFIESQLSNPGLHADVVAAHCGVSLRALHQAFSESDKTVAGCIRELRLLRCQADLRNPFLHNRSVIEIAVKWGYSAPSSFTRAYRAHFGRTPREERQAGS